MEYKVIMPYIGGILSDNSYKFLNKSTKPIVNMWKKELAKRAEELDIPKNIVQFHIKVHGKFEDERRPDIPNLFKVILDGLKKTKSYYGLGVDDKHFRAEDDGYELGFLNPVLEITIIPIFRRVSGNSN